MTEPAAPARQPRPLVRLTVLRKEQLTGHMIRVIAGGPGFASFAGNEFTDKYVKLVFPVQGARIPDGALDLATLRELLPRERWPAVRTYTVRWVDEAAGELAIDFVVHGDEGIAGPWAARALPGDELLLSGPGGKYRPAPDADWYLFACDETALPAVSAALEVLPESAVGQAFIEVDGPDDVLPLTAPDGIELVWLFRDGAAAGTSTVLADAVAGAPWRAGLGEVFVHGERGAMKLLRNVLFTMRGLDRRQVSLSGYWAYGRTEDTFQAEKKTPIGQLA